MAKKPPTKEEKEYMGAVAQLPCSVNDANCGGKIDVHHKTGAGMAKRASHFEVMPLCFNHHSAQTPLPFGHAVHKGTKTFEKLYGTQDDMIRRTKEKLCRIDLKQDDY